FTPEGRGGHVAVIDPRSNQIYFIGGSRLIPDRNPIKSSIIVYNLSNKVFYLDLKSQFSTNNPPYVELPGSQMTYGSEKGTAVVGGPSKDDVYIVGGTLQNFTLLNQIENNATITSNQTLMTNELLNTWNVTAPNIFIYRPSTKSWLSPKTVANGGPTIRRRSTSTVMDQDGRIIYIFGGREQIDTGSPTFICFNDTALSKWNIINAANPLQQYFQMITKYSSTTQGRAGHTATLFDNNTIIIIGGTT
ncbi:21731_t:CDS:2, partial [Dentiscutata erythropus]